MFQAEFLNHLKNSLPKNTSLIDAVATALDISYDAAHRRTSLKSKLSLDESIVIATYHNLSIDKFFELSDIDYVTVEKTKHIHNEDELMEYFKSSYQSLKPLLEHKKSHVLYSAKDIPIFYTIGGDTLSKFKMYVWLKLLDTDFLADNFEKYSPKIETLKHAKALGKLYENLNITEIWDVTTINSTLKQIHFYHQAGQVSTSSALELCNELNRLVNNISKKINSSNKYKFYYNELLLMNNNVLVTSLNQQSLYVPFSILSYYLTNDIVTCKQAEIYLNKQLQHSKLLNSSGEKDKRSFFNKVTAKINALYQLIEATTHLDFE